MRTRLVLTTVLVLGFAATQAGAAEDLWTESFDYTPGAIATVSTDWSLVGGNVDSYIIDGGTAGSISGNNMLDLPDSGNQTRVDRSIGTVVEGQTYRMTGYLYAENPGPSFDVALMTLLSAGSTEITAIGVDDGAMKWIINGSPTKSPQGLAIGTWQRYDLIYRSVAAAADEMEIYVDGLPATVGGTPIGVISPNTDLSTTVDNTLRLQGRDPSAFSALHFDDVSWALFEHVTWTEPFDYPTGVVHTVSANWKKASGNIDSEVIETGTAGSPSGNNMLDLPDNGSQTRVDRDIGPVVEGETYRMTIYLYSTNPGDGLDTALTTLMSTGTAQVASVGLDDGALKFIFYGSPTKSPQGFLDSTWQKHELIYRSIAGGPDEMELRIDGAPATVGGIPIGVVSPNTDLSTIAPNTLRIQGRDPSGFNALHFDDMTWEVLTKGTVIVLY